MGGNSSERDVSIHTGVGIVRALEESHDVEGILIGDDFENSLVNLNSTELIFIALHGGFGEDGQVQRYLQKQGVKYTGSGPEASNMAMDKNATKELAVQNGVPTPTWQMVQNDCIKIPDILSVPCVVKPNTEGSTFGLTIVREESEFAEAIKLAGKYSNDIMIEEYIPGRELTVGILGEKALPIVEIIPHAGLFDYESKYTVGKSKYICPAKIVKELTDKIQYDALKIYNALGCRHYGRVDFRLDNDRHHLLEANTLPGMTSTSLLPKAAQAAGISYNQLIEEIINLAIEGK